jgi:hypothetical protein
MTMNIKLLILAIVITTASLTFSVVTLTQVACKCEATRPRIKDHSKLPIIGDGESF